MATITIKGEIQIHPSAEEVRVLCGGLAEAGPVIHGSDISHALKTAILRASTSPRSDQKLVQFQGHAGDEEIVGVVEFIPEGQ